MTQKYIVTGGAGFIGANFIFHLIKEKPDAQILNIDKLTYAGNLESLKEAQKNPNYHFLKADICDKELIHQTIHEFKPDRIVHFAAESHVDRSIDGPDEFIQTNILGTYNLLKQAFNYWTTLGEEKKNGFRFLHVSTDEVYGSLGDEGFFTEETQYKPNSPYSASKASSDHLVRAWHHTFGFPVITTNCSNNYGPFQFPEKLIPVIMFNALNKKPIPIYGDGSNIRDWLYVEDHCRAVLTAIEKGRAGQVYNIGGLNEMTNLRVAETVCEILDELKKKPEGSYKDQITFVKDRPGHDMRYAIDAKKIETELGWEPKESFASGIKKTISWYLENRNWVNNILTGDYKVERLGLGEES